MASKKEPEECPECGAEPDNPKHQESYWKDRSDPREGFAGTDKGMMFTSNYYKVLDRQIAEDHHNHTKNSGASGKSGSSNPKK